MSTCSATDSAAPLADPWGLTTLQTFSLGCEHPFCNAQGLRVTLTPSAPTGPAGVQPGAALPPFCACLAQPGPAPIAHRGPFPAELELPGKGGHYRGQLWGGQELLELLELLLLLLQEMSLLLR